MVSIRGAYAKSSSTRSRILAAAREEALEFGIHRATVTGIATRAGAAVGSVHYHFGSREHLLTEMMRDLMGDFALRVAAGQRAGGDFFERQRAHLLAYVDYIRANPAHVRLADEIKLYEPEVYRDGVREWLEQMHHWLRQGVDEGALRPMDRASLVLHANFLFGARQFLEELFAPGAADAPDPVAVIEAYLDLLRRGLGAGRAS